MSKTASARRMCATTCAVVMAATLGTDAIASPREASAVYQLESYCTTSWRNARIDQQDWTDCTQEAFAELLRRVQRQGLARAIEDAESDERRELNRSIWCVAQRWRRTPRQGTLSDSLPDRVVAAANLEDKEAVERLLAAEGLRPIQRDILRRWSSGDSIAEIAQTLDLPPARVSDEKYRAIRALRKKFA